MQWAKQFHSLNFNSVPNAEEDEDLVPPLVVTDSLIRSQV